MNLTSWTEWVTDVRLCLIRLRLHSVHERNFAGL